MGDLPITEKEEEQGADILNKCQIQENSKEVGVYHPPPNEQNGSVKDSSNPVVGSRGEPLRLSHLPKCPIKSNAGQARHRKRLPQMLHGDDGRGADLRLPGRAGRDLRLRVNGRRQVVAVAQNAKLAQHDRDAVCGRGLGKAK